MLLWKDTWLYKPFIETFELKADKEEDRVSKKKTAPRHDFFSSQKLYNMKNFIYLCGVETPHTAHRTPHTAHRTPHTAHRTMVL
jgi:hypothetical protein